MNDSSRMPVSVEVFDTTLRDGTQMEGISFSVQDKLRITKRLDELGIHYIEGGWPGSNPKDIEYFSRAKELELKQAQVVAFGSTRRKKTPVQEDANVAAIVESGVNVAAIFGKSWDLHVVEALNADLDENLKMIEDTVSYLRQQGIEVIYDAEHFFDGYRANPEYALKTLEAAASGGATHLVLCDTNGGTMPLELQAAVRRIVDRFEVPVGIHAHNDGGVAVANTLLAVSVGAVHLHGTINGYGERCGNADLCSVLPNLIVNYDIECIPPENLKKLTEVSRYVDELANVNPQSNRPFVGDSAFTHKGGIHVSAMQRDQRTYEHIDPTKVGNSRRVLVSELAGRSNLRYKAEELGFDLDSEPELLKQLLEKLKELEYEGYQFEGAEASFELLIRRTLGMHETPFELEGCRIITQKNGGESPQSEAVMKVKVRGQTMHTAAEGEGPVNALDNALRKALLSFYPDLNEISLVDYKVRVLDGTTGTAAKVRVIIESSDGQRRWSTVGVSSNIIEASWQALADSIEYGLCRYAQKASILKAK